MELLLHSRLGSLSPSHLQPTLSTITNPIHFSISVASRRRRFGDSRRFFSSPETDIIATPAAAVNWWRLTEDGDDGEEEKKDQSTAAKAKQVTVLLALHRMWNLIETDRWIVFVASSLIFAALSEISIPRILTESVFCAQSGDAAVFFRNSKLLALLCITSGICRLDIGG